MGDPKLTPDWKRPLACAIFLPGSSSKNKTVQTLAWGAGARWSFPSACRNDPKEKGRRSPRSPDRLREPGTPPRPWAGEIPRLALPAPLLQGRATPQLCARELLTARLLLPVLPRPPPASLLESEGGALLGRPATRGRGSRLPAQIAQPQSRRGSRRSDLPPRRSRAPGPRPSNFVLPERLVPFGSGFGPAPAWEATSGQAPRTWRLGSPDRAPGQSALALSALPARSRRLRAVRDAGIPEPVVRAGSQKLE